MSCSAGPGKQKYMGSHPALYFLKIFQGFSAMCDFLWLNFCPIFKPYFLRISSASEFSFKITFCNFTFFKKMGLYVFQLCAILLKHLFNSAESCLFQIFCWLFPVLLLIFSVGSLPSIFVIVQRSLELFPFQ